MEITVRKLGFTARDVVHLIPHDLLNFSERLLHIYSLESFLLVPLTFEYVYLVSDASRRSQVFYDGVGREQVRFVESLRGIEITDIDFLPASHCNGLSIDHSLRLFRALQLQ